MMLGGASMLAARPEAFLTFLIPTGVLTSLRLASVGDGDHLMMGLLGAVFTVATAVRRWRFHRAIETSFMLRFDNQDLIDSLQTAKGDAEALNRELELRVRDRTAKLPERISARTNSSRRSRTSSGTRSRRYGSRWKP